MRVSPHWHGHPCLTNYAVFEVAEGGEDEDDHDDFAGMSGPGFGYRLVNGWALRDTLATEICPILRACPGLRTMLRSPAPDSPLHQLLELKRKNRLKIDTPIGRLWHVIKQSRR